MGEFSFPDNFLWGTASSAYQTEGNNTHTDWYDMELKEQKKPPARRRIKELCAGACDHWNRYEEDYDLARELGIHVHRLSVDWGRVFPEKDKPAEGALEHYRKMLKALRSRGIKVMLCLNHFTLPCWVAHRGGYVNRAFLMSHFNTYVKAVVSRLGDLVDYWLPINEPNVVPLAGYLGGVFPPFRRNFRLFKTAYRNIAEMHASSYAIIKEKFPRVPVGVAFSFQHLQPYKAGNRLHRWGTSVANAAANTCFFDGIGTGKMRIPFGGERAIPGLKGAMDFVGINYYSTMYMKGIFPVQSKPGDLVTDMGWVFYPEGLYDILIYMKENTNLPVMVTENGVATTDESFRIRYIRAHLDQIQRAITAGVPVRGYMYWSLTDNFEWQHGYGMRFGLINIDFRTQKRTIKESGRWFAELIEKRA